MGNGKMLKNRFTKYTPKGDTLIEVILSMVVISVVIGGAYMISNRSTQLGRLSQQRTQVNNHMRSQAEMLKLLRDSSLGESSKYKAIMASYTNSGTGPDGVVDCTPPPTSGIIKTFFIRGKEPIQYNSRYPSVSGDPTGLSRVRVEAYRPSTSGYTDFYIIGCWQGPGNYGQQQSFIVERLNDPS